MSFRPVCSVDTGRASPVGGIGGRVDWCWVWSFRKTKMALFLYYSRVGREGMGPRVGREEPGKCRMSMKELIWCELTRFQILLFRLLSIIAFLLPAAATLRCGWNADECGLTTPPRASLPPLPPSLPTSPSALAAISEPPDAIIIDFKRELFGLAFDTNLNEIRLAIWQRRNQITLAIQPFNLSKQ